MLRHYVMAPLFTLRYHASDDMFFERHATLMAIR